MQVHEAITQYKDTLKALSRNGVGTAWTRYLEMFNDYMRLCREGHKQMYVIAYLCEIYRLSKSQIYRILGKMLDDWRE